MSTTTQHQGRQQQLYPNGTKITKLFQDPETGEYRPYTGIIQNYLLAASDNDNNDNNADEDYMYTVEYVEDGDVEDLTESEIRELLLQQQQEQEEQENPLGETTTSDNNVSNNQRTKKKRKSTASTSNNATTSSRSRRRTTDDDEEDDDDDDEERIIISENASPTASMSVSSSSPPAAEQAAMTSSSGGRRSSSRCRSASASGRKAVNYSLDKYEFLDESSSSSESEEDDDESEEETAAKKKKVQSTKNNKKNKQQPSKKKKDDDDDDSEASFDSDDDDDDDSLSSFDAEESESESVEDDFDSDDDDLLDVKPKAKKTTTSRGKRGGTKKTTGGAGATGTAKSGGGGKKMYESFQPMNAPTFSKISLPTIAEEKEYLDPCGMEATDDIIGRLVGDQVDKIMGLLERTLTSSDGSINLGSKDNQLKLGTACSGTDAPALALTFVQEQLELRGANFILNHSHEFSCEKEPYKQAYLARNFDSILYSDIAKLADNKNPDYVPRDVYGREIPLAPIHMFVAGTSCKNFSMMRSKYRIDLEDKGCSGETFFAAVEVLWKQMPEFVIFENVIGAPWGKMSEYITGRIRLADCAENKAIKDVKSKDKKKALTFALESNGSIVVDQVPPVYGVKCGAVVEGFLKDNSTQVNPIKWPKKNKKDTCTLAELIDFNNISKANDTLVFETPCTYCTFLSKVDTKDFGLPQTRNRTYMFVWKPRNDDIHDDLGEYWSAIVNHLKSPVRHSLDAFLLDDDHDTVRVFREALNGPPGRQTKRGNYLEPYFWTSQSANLPHNTYTRKALGLEDEARWLMNWHEHGRKQLPPSFWIEYFDCCNHRILDFTDILYASGLRDAEMHDALFCNYFWNLSQNASKEKHRTACPGIAGCVTPGGDIFLPHKGRPLLGCEKLLAQGIPYFRLELGNESEVQLGDLAGNAMSLTVVSATMLAAISCKQLREDTEARVRSKGGRILKSREAILKESFSSLAKPTSSPVISSMEVDESTLTSSCEAMPVFRKLAALADDAVKASVHCTCETSGNNSCTTEFLQCRTCRVSCCRNCISQVAGYNMSFHDTQDVTVTEDEHHIGTFQTELRNILPPSLKISEDGWTQLGQLHGGRYRVDTLHDSTFLLHQIKRERRKWLALYYARENHGTGEAIAELRLIVGELKTEEIASSQSSVICGMAAELKSFVPAKTLPLVYGRLEPCARLEVHTDSSDSKESWTGNGTEVSASVKVSVSGSTPSIRKEVGLEDTVADDIRKFVKDKRAKDFQEAKRRGEEHRWLYPSDWKSVPDTISIQVEDDVSLPLDINGDYKRSACRQTVNQSSLWVKPGNGNGVPSLYILIRPNTGRTGPDQVIISSSIDHNDDFSILAVFPVGYVFKSKVETLELKQTVQLPSLKCLVPHSEMSVESGDATSDVLVKVSGLSKTQVQLLCRALHVDPHDSLVRLKVSGGQTSQQIVRAFNSLCTAPILKFTAQSSLKYNVSRNAEWSLIPSPSGGSTPFGRCTKTVPTRPSESWVFNTERSVWERSTEAGASRKYYLALQEAPKPFELWMDQRSCSLTVKCFPEVVAHHAAGNLIRGRGSEADFDKNLKVAFKLSDVSQQPDPVISPYTVFNCNSEDATNVTLNKPHCLYERQQKVVTKMKAIENGETSFEELEISEFEMPGSTGLSLIAKASRETSIRGAVIADAIGAGKTVISIALILQGLKKARAARQAPRNSGATLVVVPPGLIDQWDDEIDKFSQGLTVIKIYDCGSLKKVTVQEIVDCDVVICPIDLLESQGYLENLFVKAGLKKYCDDVPKLPTYSGQAEQTMARGVWIPATSTDPYGGGNSPLSQRRRDQSAYYTSVYKEAISKCRTKSFKGNEKGVPLEYFVYDRIIADEIHESLCTTKAEMDEVKKNTNTDSPKYYKEKNRRAGRELLGIAERDMSQRPLTCRGAMFGLTGTPLLDCSSRVIELANVMGGVYVTSLSSHWRKLERESSRDIFLHNFLEPKQSREIRQAVHTKCQHYLNTAACRNKCGEEMKGITLNKETRSIKMSDEEKELYLDSQSGIPASKRSLSIKPEDYVAADGHDISKLLIQNAKLESRGKQLVSICQEILQKDPTTKIVVFTDGRVGAGKAAIEALNESGLGCTHLDEEDSNQVRNQKISWYQRGDATKEDRARPRVLVLHFEHAAGLNLQRECFNMVLFCPLYVGNGGSSSDAVSDVSTELQAMGRVFRPGQARPKVNVFRIVVEGPEGEECLDGQILRRNTNEDTIAQAVNSGEDDTNLH